MSGCDASMRPARGGGAISRLRRISVQRLLRLNARLADDFPPLRYFRPEPGGAVLGRAGDRLVTERRQAFLDVPPADRLCNVPLPPRDDVPGPAPPPYAG